MWRPPNDCFEVSALSDGWGKPTLAKPIEAPVWRNEESKKQLYGIELAKCPMAFEAACKLFTNTIEALWVAQNWESDPIVIAAKDAYNEILETKLLDKDALARKLLKFADEKDATGRFYITEAKDRLAALKLYAEIQGFVGKVEIDQSSKNFTQNVMKIVLVKSDKNKQTENLSAPIEHQSEIKSLPNIKLVSASR